MRTDTKVLLVGLSLGSLGAGFAHADVEFFDLAKARYYVQDSGSPPVAPEYYAFESYVDLTDGGDAAAVTLDGVPFEGFDSNTAWDFRDEFVTKAELDAAYPQFALHTIVISGGTLGVRSETLSLPPLELYPAPPAFTPGTMGSIPGADSTVDLVVEWANAPVGTSLTIFSLYDVAADECLIDLDIAVGTSFTIEASLLEPDTEYEVLVAFANVVVASGSASPGFGVQAESLRGFLSATSAAFTTAPTSQVGEHYAGVLKVAEYVQIADNTQPGAPESWTFEAYFDAAPGVIASGSVSGGASVLPMTEYEPGLWDVDDNVMSFASKSEFDAQFPSDTFYTIDVEGGVLGTRSQTLSIGPDAYPAPGYLTGTVLSDLQDMDPTQEFMLTWSAPDPSVILVGLFVERTDTDETPLELIVPPFVTNVAIPAELLVPGVEYEVGLTFANIGVRLGDGAPAFDQEAVLTEGYLVETFATFTTDDGLVDCPADLAAPFGSLNFFDIAAFIGLFNAGDLTADFAAPFGSLNFFDVVEYITQFNAGCP